MKEDIAIYVGVSRYALLDSMRHRTCLAMEGHLPKVPIIKFDSGPANILYKCSPKYIYIYRGNKFLDTLLPKLYITKNTAIMRIKNVIKALKGNPYWHETNVIPLTTRELATIELAKKYLLKFQAPND
jgi:hypothetical protein